MTTDRICIGILAVFALAALAAAIGTPHLYLQAILIAVMLAVTFKARDVKGAGFYQLCTGEAVVVAAGGSDFPVAVILQILLVAMLLRSTGIMQNRDDLVWFIPFCGAAAIIGIALLPAGHVLFPLLALFFACCICTVLLTITGYRIRTMHRGDEG